MSEQKFDPLKEIANLRDSISQSLSTMTSGKAKFPLVDVYEDDANVVVVTEPILGLDMAQLVVSMEDDTLTIQGVTQPSSELPETTRYIQREIFYGEFKRTVRIDRQIDLANIKATYKSGILKIEMPKVEQSDSGQIIAVTPIE